MGLYIKQNGAIKPLAGSTPGEGLPVGAITAFTANSIPSGWLLCDGSTFDETLYPALFLALGGNVLPDLRNRFLEGADSVVREYKDAGLPNITGTWDANYENDTYFEGPMTGAFSVDKDSSRNRLRGDINGNGNGVFRFNAKNGETKTDGTLKTEDEAHVYGNSDTVQPASYTVNYIIKATSGITTEAALDAFNMIKEYERKQNLLSDIETITLTTTDTVMPYDGYISVYWTGSQAFETRRVWINDVLVGLETSGGESYKSGGDVSFVVKQGDRVRADTSLLQPAVVRWYKERDYEGRA